MNILDYHGLKKVEKIKIKWERKWPPISIYIILLQHLTMGKIQE